MYTMTANRPGPLHQILISQVTGKRYPDTKAGRDALDKDEGRQKLYNDQMEAMIVLMGAYRIARKAAPMLKPFGKKTGTGRMLSAAVGLLGNAIYSMCGKVCVNQFRTIEHNTTGVSITVSASKVPGMVNIDCDHLLAITDRALEACEMYCTADCEASKSCLLREALEAVPMMGDLPRGASADECPYRGVRLEGVDHAAD
jgi:hypothetical protein